MKVRLAYFIFSFVQLNIIIRIVQQNDAQTTNSTATSSVEGKVIFVLLLFLSINYYYKDCTTKCVDGDHLVATSPGMVVSLLFFYSLC